ncbi:type IV pilus modification PilV family protein [Kinneretia aquatilis]|uniref:type IV pilus modification PilV family protein n=1 Tax=Kinneretia aquatilis TaxID=2070761 RepID=UPI00149531A8|nr:hypothetical protein [Paucibacter aquatile]WIV99955.1 hypothetical protein K9V56_011015 [Paucibacter aquatile]
MKPVQAPPGSSQFGVALIEALVALLIMAFGMVALIGLQGTMRRASDLSKQRSEAMRIAQSELERLRDFSVATINESSPAGTRDFASIQSLNACTGEEGEGACLQSINVGNASYSISRTVGDWTEALSGHTQALPPMRNVQVRVSWVDRAAGAQFVQLDSFISKAETFLSGSLVAAPSAGALRRPGERDASIPVQAKDLGNKTSVFVPGPTATVAWVFNNLTGVITGRCTVAAGTASSSLTLQDVESCSNTTVGYLLSGTIRFSNNLRPDPANPEGFALPLDVVITNSRLADAIAAPTVQQCFDDAPTSPSSTMPFVSYNCFIEPNNGTPRIWSGRAELSGIELTGANARKVCRYSADYDGNGSISNAEHPENYNAVSSSLARQNFLVINASVSRCPTGAAVDPANGVFVNSNTELQQAAPAQP